MTRLPDAVRSRAVLIGVGRYQLLSDLGAVHNNVNALADALRDGRLWGLPPGNCTVVEDPALSADILEPLAEAAREATDTLLIYFAGHCLATGWGGELHLALTGSDPQTLDTAVAYRLVRDLLMDSRAARRIVILDCCYTGRSLEWPDSAGKAVASEASAEGVYVLASVDKDTAVVAPPGARLTTFTGELLNIFEHGIIGRGPLLDLHSIYMELVAAKGFPNPQKRDRNSAGQLTLVRNRAYLAAAVEPAADLAPAEPGHAAPDELNLAPGTKEVWTDDQVTGTAISKELAGHAFISYVREDSKRVDQLQRALEMAGIQVWRDTSDLWPGEDWRMKIRRAITNNALVFIACFSENSLARGRSYQNEELVLAIEQLRLLPAGEPWLIPVRLDECEIPDRDIGAGRTLNSIQRADLFGDHADHGTARLTQAVLRILGRSDGSKTGWPGPYVGKTLGETRSVGNFDPLLAAARSRPAAAAITGGPSIGKKTLLFLLIRQLALQGSAVVVVDPNGVTNSLAAALQARGHRIRMHSLGQAPAGILDPFSLSDALPQKRAIAFDTLRLLLPRMSEERESAVVQAVAAVSAGPRPSLGKIIRLLEESDDMTWKNAGAELRSISAMRLGRVIFAPSGGRRFDAAEGTTIFTGDGLALPDATVKQDDYSYDQRLAVAITCLTAQAASRLLADMPRQTPKALFLDEAWAVTLAPEGAKLVPEVSRVGPSRNVALVLASSNTGGLLSEQVADCISSVFAFRSATQLEALNVMALLGVAGSFEQEIALRTLSDTEFIYRDLEGAVGASSTALVSEEMQKWLENSHITSAYRSNPAAGQEA